MTVIRLHHFTLLACAALFVSSCVGSGGIPEEHFYRLPELRSTAPHQPPPIRQSISVPRLRATGLLHERALLYSNSKQPNDVRSYHYHQWQDPPGILVRDHLIAYLRDSGLSPRVVAPASGARADLKLTGKLIRLEQATNGEQVSAIVEVEFSLLRGGETLLGPTLYKAKVETGGPSINTTIDAFGNALKIVYDKLIADLMKTRVTGH